MRRRAGRGGRRTGGLRLLLRVADEVLQRSEDVLIRRVLLHHGCGDVRGRARWQHASVAGAEMLQPAVQEADHELLLLSAQRADDLAHRGVIPRRAGSRDHQVDVIVADLLFKLGLLALGDEAAAFAGDADVVPGQAIRQGVGPSRSAGKQDHREHADHEGQESSHATSLHGSRSPYAVRDTALIRRLVLRPHLVMSVLSSLVVAGSGGVLVASAPAGSGPCGGPAGGGGDQVCRESADLAERDRDEAAARAFGAVAAVTDSDHLRFAVWPQPPHTHHLAPASVAVSLPCCQHGPRTSAAINLTAGMPREYYSADCSLLSEPSAADSSLEGLDQPVSQW